MGRSERCEQCKGEKGEFHGGDEMRMLEQDAKSAFPQCLKPRCRTQEV